jgi:general secretion pathway protein G
MSAQRRNSKGFTLVEILIVVIILGILAAIVIPQFTNASTDARKNSLTSQLQTIRSQMELYKLQHNDKLPAFAGATADLQWEQMTGQTDVNGGTTTKDFGPYLQQTPANPLNSNSKVVAGGSDATDASFATAGTGFYVNTVNGKVWASNQTATKLFDETTGFIE